MNDPNTVARRRGPKPMAPEAKKKLEGVYLSPGVRDQVVAIAAHRDAPLSVVLRELIVEALRTRETA